MTIKEIAKVLGYSYRAINYAFSDAEAGNTKEAESLRGRKEKSTKIKVADYTLEESLYALTYMPTFTNMQKVLLIENFIHRDKPFVDTRVKRVTLNKSARQFIGLYKLSNGAPKVCSTCAYLKARKIRKIGSHYSPYCNLYNVFLNKAKPYRDIYRDRCECYEKSEKEPLIFNKQGIVDLDIDENVKPTILGYDPAILKTGKTKKGEPINLLVNN